MEAVRDQSQAVGPNTIKQLYKGERLNYTEKKNLTLTLTTGHLKTNPTPHVTSNFDNV